MNKNQIKFLQKLSEMMKILGVEMSFVEMNLSKPKELMKIVYEMEEALANEIAGETETESIEAFKSTAFASVYDKMHDGQILQLSEDNQLIMINSTKYIAFLKEKLIQSDCFRCDLRYCTETQKAALYGKCSLRKWAYLKKA